MSPKAGLFLLVVRTRLNLLLLLCWSLLLGVGWEQRPISVLKSFGLFKEPGRVNSQPLGRKLIRNVAS